MKLIETLDLWCLLTLLRPWYSYSSIAQYSWVISVCMQFEWNLGIYTPFFFRFLTKEITIPLIKMEAILFGTFVWLNILHFCLLWFWFVSSVWLLTMLQNFQLKQSFWLSMEHFWFGTVLVLHRRWKRIRNVHSYKPNFIHLTSDLLSWMTQIWHCIMLMQRKKK